MGVNVAPEKTTEYKQALKAFHKVSDRHVLVLEAEMSHPDKCHIFHYADLQRKAGNELVGIMRNRYEQLIRTKRYRKLLALYGKYTSNGDKKKAKHIATQMNTMQEQYDVTWDFCRKAMIPIGKKYGLGSVTALTRAEDIWSGLEKCLFKDGKTIHFIKRGELPSIRAKQIKSCIILSTKQDSLWFKFNDISFTVLIKDAFERKEVEYVLSYLQEPETIDRKAVHAYLTNGIISDTYRPCYASLVCKKIRGKLRVYVHLTIEGKAIPKQNKDGTARHSFGTGIVGCDIGIQTVAYTSDTEVGLKNLAERGSSIFKSERQERRLKRAMERSRRASNPQNYNEDGTIKKGQKRWRNSKRYFKLREKYRELCRINAENRRYAIQEEINHLRTLGNIFVTEPKNAKALAKRAKKTAKNAKGKYKRKKRFGRSIQNRCPGYFQKQAERRFTSTHGSYIEVPKDYRASQYDHIADAYIKKKLSNRMYQLTDGTLVQRDWYSSYLLYCYDLATQQIDKEKCNSMFNTHYQKEKALIQDIKKNKIKILNSGIKVS